MEIYNELCTINHHETRLISRQALDRLIPWE